MIVANAAETSEVPLGAGVLSVRVEHADWPLESLCTFAARNNPRRAFLVVSRVLGRHIAVTPAAMRATFRDLATKLPLDMPGPVLVVGLAETAICLGQGLHEELLRRTGRSDLLYLHSTRQQLDHPLLCRFEEPHSHASTHLIYEPLDPAGRRKGTREQNESRRQRECRGDYEGEAERAPDGSRDDVGHPLR